MDEISKRVEEYVERGAGLIRADLLSEARYDLIRPLLGAGMSGPVQVGDREARVFIWTKCDLFDDWHTWLVSDVEVDEERRAILFNCAGFRWALFDLSILPEEERVEFEKVRRAMPGWVVELARWEASQLAWIAHREFARLLRGEGGGSGGKSERREVS
jgi:hypothetical protein